jgi:hypothetical protein
MAAPTTRPLTNQKALNRESLALGRAKLGDVLVDLITLCNQQNAVIKTLVTKLNADAGVTDTNYTAASLADVKGLEDR